MADPGKVVRYGHINPGKLWAGGPGDTLRLRNSIIFIFPSGLIKIDSEEI